MRPVVFIDGREGTTGLQICRRLEERGDVTLLSIDESKRKDPATRRDCINAADLVFLCLPDAAAREAVAMAENPDTRIIDASTAHRTAPGWVYGFGELRPNQKAAISEAKRVANPGCHATGFLACTAPLTQAGVLPAEYPLTCCSLTGYTGGGKQMIAEYEDPARSAVLDAPGLYALGLNHKHLAEMTQVAGLAYPPAFSPILADMPQGMATTVLFHNRLLAGNPTAEDVWALLADHYAGQPLVTVLPFGGTGPRLSANTLAGTDRLEITVSGHGEQTLVAAVFDNLGKGASGAAVQNMNLMLGLPETAGLNL